MRHRFLLLPVMGLVLWAGLAQAQQIKAPADLFPAGTLAYAEVRQPGALAQEIRSLFQGSALGNVPESLTRLQDRVDPNHSGSRVNQEVGAFGLLLAPEVIAEVSRLKGAAIGLTGMGKDGTPEFLAVILPGTSQAPSFILRAALAMGPMRPLGKVEEVAVYQMMLFSYQRGPQGNFVVVQKPGPALAMMPGALFVGSPEEVKNAIRRARGKGEGETLAQSKLFQEILPPDTKEAGLYAYVEVAGLLKSVAAPLQRQRGGKEVLAVLNKVINPRASRGVGYRLTLNKGTFRYRKTVYLDPREKSPVLELFPTTPLSPDLLHYVPQDAVLVAALSNGGGAKRRAQFLDLADQLAQLGPQEGLPSDMVKALNERLQIDLGKDVFGKITNVAFAVGDPFRAAKKPEVPLVLVVQAVDEQAATKMVEEVLPRVFRMVTREKEAKPAAQEVEGRKVYTLKWGAHQALHYGRQGNVIVLGPFQAPVAKALAAGAAGKGWLADPKRAALLKEPRDPLAFVAVKPVTVLMGWYLVRSESRPDPIQAAPTAPLPRSGPKPAPAIKKERAVTAEGGPADKEFEKIQKEIARLVAKEEPLVLSITRTGDRMTGEMKMAGLKPLVAGLTDFVIEQLYRSQARRVQRPKR